MALIGRGLPQPSPAASDEALVRRALALLVDDAGHDVRPADCQADVPVAALVVDPQGRVVAEAVNRREADGDPTAHAEVLALRAAAKSVGDRWRLEGCTLVVTLEPCPMCAGAAVGARVQRIVFGAWEPKTGGCGSLIDIPRVPGAAFVPEVVGGVCEAPCAAVLERFFRAKR
ncbi:nucleoside deaminase [Lawsonella clevelandensis]|uniref:nucleoside deaminase n=1 Tax=Lawsonella clevelandensis TaxID=1528099 RepID=UPI002912EE6A|nr:nucleoside deaminase [Lawsonella clevelandensis]MDU7193436.1 nucleoside deaminase [Lawsonella clevelandensis]